MADATLRRVTDRTWHGTLHGYRVQVFATGTPPAWYFAAIHPKGHTCVCPPAASLADAARQARAWVEAHPLAAG